MTTRDYLAIASGVVIAIGLSWLITAAMSQWFVRSGIHTLTGVGLGPGDWADGEKVAAADRRSAIRMQRTSKVMRRGTPIAIALIVVGIGIGVIAAFV